MVDEPEAGSANGHWFHRIVAWFRRIVAWPPRRTAPAGDGLRHAVRVLVVALVWFLTGSYLGLVIRLPIGAAFLVGIFCGVVSLAQMWARSERLYHYLGNVRRALIVAAVVGGLVPAASG